MAIPANPDKTRARDIVSDMLRGQNLNAWIDIMAYFAPYLVQHDQVFLFDLLAERVNVRRLPEILARIGLKVVPA